MSGNAVVNEGVLIERCDLVGRTALIGVLTLGRREPRALEHGAGYGGHELISSSGEDTRADEISRDDMGRRRKTAVARRSSTNRSHLTRDSASASSKDVHDD